MNRTIVHVASYGNPARGSFIPALERLARAAAAQGDRVAVVAPTIENASWPASLAEAGVELRLIRTPWEAAIATRELSADIVHAHFSRYDVPVALAHATTGARIFWHVHSATIAAKHRDRLAPLKSFVKHRIVGARVEAMIAVAEPVARELLEWHVPPLKLHVIENGVDTDRFSLPTDAERASARGALGIAANERVLAFFDRSAVKGGATLREAMRELRGWRLLVVGGTSQSRAAFGEPPAVIPIERSHDTR
ncbi:MAG: glycosyltransferase family 4 protein, partial [Candidatus Eremiobacteraeota bacterium]|nr:glycosyltransferase family 4 protein [Candidatus Eremiobacteraeota bacterium]